MFSSYKLFLEIKIPIIPRKYYFYTKGKGYLREKLASRKGVVAYRIKKIKPGIKILIGIMKKKGPKGGRTKAIAILRDTKRLDLRKYLGRKTLEKALKKVRKLSEK